MSIKKQISIINNEIKDKAELIAVSKTRSIDDINEAYNQGQKKFGENRVQEIVDKFNKLPKDIEWHMIGHLQKNKVKYISEFISLIHSLDRLSLANEIDKNGKKTTPIKLSDYNGKFKIIYCFQHWCPGCHSQGLPTLKKLVDAFQGNDKIVFFAVSAQNVSTEIIILGKVFFNNLIIGKSFFSSSLADTCVAPGRDD